ncbi:hypothetical protein F5Y16DRAFT_376340 [Xylariaceae sp. FL0255]|nr:hypothetical protein F5Y16DRAFT_376340 [Xylariaceae sp. FL0255]
MLSTPVTSLKRGTRTETHAPDIAVYQPFEGRRTESLLYVTTNCSARQREMMLYRAFTAATWLCIASVTAVSGWEHGSSAELRSAIADNEVVVVALLIPKHLCSEKAKALQNEWEQLKTEVQVSIVSIDCTSEAELCALHGDPESSTIKLFKRENEVSRYQGPRRASAILGWIDRTQRSIITDLDDASLESFQKLDDVVFIAYIPMNLNNGKDAVNAFTTVAGKFFGEFSFGIVSDAEAGKEAMKVVCYKHLDGMTHELEGLPDADALEKFIIESSRPVIGELLPHNQQRFPDRGWPMVYIFGASETERSALRASLKDIARKQYESLTTVLVDPLDFPELQAKLGLEPGVSPAGAIHQLSNNRIFPYPEGREITPKALQSWGLDVWQGRVKPWTPPGVTTTYDDLGGRIQATQRVSMKGFNIPGVKLKVGGRDEL